jgi:glycosyltransferase involved in cell wall biosynthesis
MNILIYSPRAFAIPETFIYNLLNLKNYELDIYIAYNYKLNESEFPFNNLISEHIPSKAIGLIDRVSTKFINLFSRSYLNLPYLSKKTLVRFIKKNNIKVIYCQYGVSAIPIYKICIELNLKLVIHFHGYDASSLLKDAHYSNSLKKMFTSDVKYQVITVANYMKQNLLRLGLKEHNTSLVQYGINLSPFNKKVEKDNNLIKLLHAGRLTSKKGVPDLLRVFSCIITEIDNPKKLELKIIGDGEDAEICQKIIIDNKLEGFVEMLGAKPHGTVIDHMLNSDIFILNSRTSPEGDMEGFPNTIIEAMAAQCAVISTFHAGIPDAIENGINGMLVKEKDNEALKNAILKLIEDKELRINLASKAHTKAFEKFSKEDQLKKIKEVLLK